MYSQISTTDYSLSQVGTRSSFMQYGSQSQGSSDASQPTQIKHQITETRGCLTVIPTVQSMSSFCCSQSQSQPLQMAIQPLEHLGKRLSKFRRMDRNEVFDNNHSAFFKSYKEKPPLIKKPQQEKITPTINSFTDAVWNFGTLLKDFNSKIDKFSSWSDIKSAVDSLLQRLPSNNSHQEVLVKVNEISDQISINTSMLHTLLQEKPALSCGCKSSKPTLQIERDSKSCQTTPNVSSLLKNNGKLTPTEKSVLKEGINNLLLGFSSVANLNSRKYMSVQSSADSNHQQCTSSARNTDDKPPSKHHYLLRSNDKTNVNDRNSRSTCESRKVPTCTIQSETKQYRKSNKKSSTASAIDSTMEQVLIEAKVRQKSSVKRRLLNNSSENLSGSSQELVFSKSFVIKSRNESPQKKLIKPAPSKVYSSSQCISKRHQRNDKPMKKKKSDRHGRSHRKENKKTSHKAVIDNLLLKKTSTSACHVRAEPMNNRNDLKKIPQRLQQRQTHDSSDSEDSAIDMSEIFA